MWWITLGLPIDMANPGYMLSLSLFDYNMDDVIAGRDSPIHFSDITAARFLAARSGHNEEPSLRSFSNPSAMRTSDITKTETHCV
jgi:hypothetical protein